MNFYPKQILFVLILLLIISLQGCANKGVRHLASDVCLISKGISKKEVMAHLGMPHERYATENGEKWIYFQVKKSLLRNTPYIGENLGTEDVEVATVQFTGDKVITCVYRSMTAEEFKNSGISVSKDDPRNE